MGTSARNARRALHDAEARIAEAEESYGHWKDRALRAEASCDELRVERGNLETHLAGVTAELHEIVEQAVVCAAELESEQRVRLSATDEQVQRWRARAAELDRDYEALMELTATAPSASACSRRRSASSRRRTVTRRSCAGAWPSAAANSSRRTRASASSRCDSRRSR